MLELWDRKCAWCDSELFPYEMEADHLIAEATEPAELAELADTLQYLTSILRNSTCTVCRTGRPYVVRYVIDGSQISRFQGHAVAKSCSSRRAN